MVQPRPAGDRPALEQMLCSLADVIASYHRIPTDQLPQPIASAAPAIPDIFERQLQHFSEHLDTGLLEHTAVRLARAAGLAPGRVDRWMHVVEPCLRMAPTLTHGDINEGQIMVDSQDQVVALIDWESVGAGHPLQDFNFGEWGPGIWNLERDFARLRRLCWQRYVEQRRADLPDWRAVHLLLTIIAAPPPEGDASDWSPSRRSNTLANLAEIDAHL